MKDFKWKNNKVKMKDSQKRKRNNKEKMLKLSNRNSLRMSRKI